jgi:CHAD domain-containing protein
LGTLRELDVLVGLMAELRDTDRYPPRAVECVTARVEALRQKAGRKLPGKATAAELCRVAARLARIEQRLSAERETLAGRRTWVWALHARVARRAAALRSTIEHAGALYLPERLHDVRIALKKFRYGVELLDEAEGAMLRAELRTLKRLQDVLGRLHDIQVLVDQARRVQASLDPPDLLLWHDLSSLVIGLEQNARRLHARYVRDRDAILDVCHRLTARGAAGKLRREASAAMAGGSRSAR